MLQDVPSDANQFSRRLKPVRFIPTCFICLLLCLLVNCNISGLLVALGFSRRTALLWFGSDRAALQLCTAGGCVMLAAAPHPTLKGA